jgi:putative ABC transport system permease protein
MQTLWQDLRYGARMLLRRPGLTLIAVVTLAIGIGLNTALFSIVNSILLRQLPFHEPERLMQVWETWSAEEAQSGTVSPNNLLDWRAQARSFAALSGYSIWLFTLTGTNEPTEIPGLKVTANFFAALGVTPQLGRTFLPEEERPGGAQSVVISHDFWQSRFGGRADAIGRKLRLDDGTYTVIGVLRPDFRQTEFRAGYRAEVWVPMELDPAASLRGNHSLRVIGRLQPGVTEAQAQTEMSAIAGRLAQTYPATNAGRGVRLVPMLEEVTGNVRRVLWQLQFATVLVLLIACGNIANLLLARVAEREKELAIRAALGAGRWRIARLLLAEGAALAALGGALGALLAKWSLDALVALAPKTIPRLDEIALDGRALTFTLLTSMATALLFGLAPAWQAGRVNLNGTLKEAGRGATRGHGLRGALVVAEVALTLVLLAGAGLLVRSLVQMQRVDLGFHTERLLTMRVSLLDSKYPERRQVADFYQQLLARVMRLPGVQSAAATSNPPLIKLSDNWISFFLEGQPADPGRAPTAKYALVSPDFFRTMEIPLRAGRDFNEHDTHETTQVAVVNEYLARRHFPKADPLGKRLLVGRTTREIVGVVGNLRHESPEGEEAEKLYVPLAQSPRTTLLLMARTATEPESLAVSIQQTVWRQDPDAAVSNVATMETALGESVARPRFNASLFGLFAVVALILAAIGLFGVMSYTVTQSTREIGVRMALGAQTRDVLKLVVGQGLALTITGLVLGLIGAWGLTRLMKNLLYGVTATDPLTFICVSVLLVFIALLACYIPARRATKVDPMVALRRD